MVMFGGAILAAGWLAALALLVGCASPPTPRSVLHESPRGSVFLEPAEDRLFQATHPVTVVPAVLARVLEGARVRSEASGLQSLLETRPEVAPVFTERDVHFLSPLLAEALARATPNQRVGFRVPSPSVKGSQGTAGAMSVLGRSLFLTLSWDRTVQRSGEVSTLNTWRPDSTGLRRRHVFFEPAAAVRPEFFQPREPTGYADEATLVIDYQLLANLPRHAPATALQPGRVPATTSADPTRNPGTGGTSSTEQPMTGENAELESLKEEVRRLQQKLADQETTLEGLRESLEREKASPPRR